MRQCIHADAIDWSAVADCALRKLGNQQAALAERLGVHQSSVSRLLRRGATPDGDRAVRLIELAGGTVVLPALAEVQDEATP